MVDDNTEWIKELRKRLHDQGNQISRLEGQMLADRMIAEERNKQNESKNKEIRDDLAVISGMVTNQANVINEINQGQKAIIQKMELDERARHDTAKALREAEEERRKKRDEPWITPNRVIALVLGLSAVVALFDFSKF